MGILVAIAIVPDALGGIAVAYALVSVVLGVLAAGLGIWLGNIMLHGTIAEEEQIETEEVDG